MTIKNIITALVLCATSLPVVTCMNKEMYAQYKPENFSTMFATTHMSAEEKRNIINYHYNYLIKKYLELAPVTFPHNEEIKSATWSPVGNCLLTASGSTVRLWSIATKTCVQTYQYATKVTSAQFSPKGTYILITFDDYTAKLLTVATGYQKNLLKSYNDTLRRFLSWGLFSATFSPCEHHVFVERSSLYGQSDLGLLDITNNSYKKLCDMPDEARLEAAMFIDDGSKIVYAIVNNKQYSMGYIEHIIKTIDSSTGNCLNSFQLAFSWAVNFSACGNYLILNQTAKNHVYDIKNLKLSNTFKNTDQIALSPCGNYITAIDGYWLELLTSEEPTTYNKIMSRRCEVFGYRSPGKISFSPCGNFISYVSHKFDDQHKHYMQGNVVIMPAPQFFINMSAEQWRQFFEERRSYFSYLPGSDYCTIS